MVVVQDQEEFDGVQAYIAENYLPHGWNDIISNNECRNTEVSTIMM